MPDDSSEQSLRALESSKADLGDLLDEAAHIVQAHYDNNSGAYTAIHQNRKSSYTFREQWVLKWLVRKIDDASQRTKNNTNDGKEERQHFLLNPKTWALCSYLLAEIPQQTSVSILLERNFTKTLVRSSQCVLHHDSDDHIDYVTRAAGSDQSDRPSKRVRLSPATEDRLDSESKTPVTGGANILTQYVNISQQWAGLLQPRQQEANVVSVRTVIPSWSGSVDEAAQFLGCVLASVILEIKASMAESVSEVSTSTVIEWLRLWHSFATSNSINHKNGVGQAFNNACLQSCLELCEQTSNIKMPHVSEMVKEIRKCVALYTIIPLRSIFFAKHREAWGKHRHSISWQNIESVLRMLQTQLGSALHIEEGIDHQVALLPDPRWAGSILSIASHITPKDDAATRQVEFCWLEVLVLCLLYLSYPRSMPKMAIVLNRLQPVENSLPRGIQQQRQWPNALLQVLMAEEIQLSASVREYLVSALLAWEDQPIPVPLLATIVNLEPALFVPGADSPNSSMNQHRLLQSLDETPQVDQTEYLIIVHDIIDPIWRSLARTRNYDDLLNMWLPRLRETIRVRASTSFSRDRIPSVFIWDDGHVITLFEELYQSNVSPTVGNNLLIGVSDDLQTISQRIGPTSDIFANMIALESTLKLLITNENTAREPSPALNMYADLVADAVRQQNDYQGQRWRLWSTLATLHKIDQSYSRFSLTANAIEASCSHFDSIRKKSFAQLQQHLRTPILMEQYTIFTLLVEYCTANDGGLETSLEHARAILYQQVKALSEILSDLSHVSSESPKTENTILWDGQVNNLRHAEQLAGAELVCLIDKPDILDDDKDTMTHLVKVLANAIVDKDYPRPKEQSPRKSVAELAVRYILDHYAQDDSRTDRDEINGLRHRHSSGFEVSFEQPTAVTSLGAMHAAISNALSEHDVGSAQAAAAIDSLHVDFNEQRSELGGATTAGMLVINTKDTDLHDDPNSVKVIASMFDLHKAVCSLTGYNVILMLEQCLLALRYHPRIVNQATIDILLGDLNLLTSADAKLHPDGHSSTIGKDRDWATAVFDRIVAVIGLLLARYRRRLTGRAHLVVPVLQNLMKCFFYTPSKRYMYRIAGNLKQKQAFRSSLPRWLDKQPLAPSSAVKFSKIISSICNPTTASARSAHKDRRKSNGVSMQLNDEIQKARKIAAQYMQYLLIEYTKCTLDGVIEPEVREHLLPGVFSILDAMDKDLVAAMNASMDPSSRAIFKGLYGEWDKHWRWKQT